MRNPCQTRLQALQKEMETHKWDVFLAADPDTIFYYSGVWGYLGMEWNRATLLLVPRSGDPVLITPAMEAEMAGRMTSITDIRPWSDGLDGEWQKPLGEYLEGYTAPAVYMEAQKTPSTVLSAARKAQPRATFDDGTPVLSQLRLIKSPEDIDVMRQAGQVAVAMAEAGRNALRDGIPEYEVALAIIAGGTRKAAELLANEGNPSNLFSPTIYNLQAMQSGHDTCMVHRKSTVKSIAHGDPVYFCFCGLANFKQTKLGFDREYFVGTVTDEQARLYELAVAAQQGALAELRPGVTCEEVHSAAEEIYRSGGLGMSYRTGRGVGYSFLEEPQLKKGDKTVIQPGMTFSVDGGITIPGQFGARVGDSVLVTDDGFEYLTPYPRDLTIV